MTTQSAETSTPVRVSPFWDAFKIQKDEAGKTLQQFLRRGEAHEPGGLPDGWTHLHTFAMPTGPAGGTPLALVHTGTLWAIVYGGRADMNPARGDVATVLTAPTVGHLADRVMRRRSLIWTEYWEELNPPPGLSRGDA